MTPRRRAVLILVLVVGSGVVGSGVAGSGAAALPAYAVLHAASDDRLVLSADRSTWAPNIATPLLDPDLVWVPGDVETGVLYARNVSGQSASGTVTVHLDGGPDGAGDPLVDALNLRVRTGSGPWTEGPTSVITDLPPGAELPIRIEVGFDPAATNATQLRTAQLDVFVTLSALGSDGGPGGGGPDGGSGEGGSGGVGPGYLPRTGADLLVPVLLAAGAIVLGVLVRRGARHE